MSKQSRTSAGIERTPFILWGGILFIFVFLLFSAFDRALFNGKSPSFEAPIVIYQMIALLGTIFFSLYLYTARMLNPRIQLIHCAVWLVPLCYLLSMPVSSSAHSAWFTFGIYMFLSFFFVMSCHYGKILLLAKVLSLGMAGSGFVIVLFGLMNWFGDASFWGLLNWSDIPGTTSTTYRDAVMIDANGERLTSVFQYANSYAAYLIAIILVSLIVIANSRRRYIMITSLLMLTPALISLVLTLSRGGIVTLPIVMILVLPFMRAGKQILSLIHLGIGSIASLAILNVVTSYGLSLQHEFHSHIAFTAWSILIGTSVIVAGLGFAVQFVLAPWVFRKVSGKWNRFESLRLSRLIFPVSGIVIGLLGMYALFGNSGFVRLLPEQIGTRIENMNWNQHSVLERETFYQDALRLWQDYPILGAGGGAWGAMYEKYQNNPYTSRQAHNFFLQTLVEVGLLGLLALLLFLGLVLYHFLRSYWKKPEDDKYPYLIFYTFAASILVHSLIDFDMSYVYLGALVYLSLGGMLAANELPPFRFQQQRTNNSTRYIYPSFLLVASVIFLFISSNQLSGNRQYYVSRANLTQQKPLPEVMNPLNAALSKALHPEYADLKINLLTRLYEQTGDPSYSQEAEDLLATMEQREPYYKSFVYRKLQLLLLKEDYGGAVTLLESKIPDFPWDIQLYSELASIHYQYGALHRRNGRVKAAQEQWDQAFIVLDRVNEKAHYLDTLPEAQLQGRVFGLTPELALPLGQIYYSRGEFALAEPYLAMRVDPAFDDTGDIEALVYYIAALRKQNKDDPALLSALAEQLSAQYEPLLAQIQEVVDQQPLPK